MGPVAERVVYQGTATRGPFSRLPIETHPAYHDRGMALAIVELVDVRRMRPGDEEAACRPYDPDLWAWVTDRIQLQRIAYPWPVKGRLHLFEVETEGPL
jgi:hypothetical protein